MVARGGQPGVLIEARRGDEVQMRSTDSRGRFDLSGIRPGIWKLRMSTQDLPNLHYAERDTLTIEVPPGGRKEMEFKLLPRKRRIRMLQEETLIATPAPSPAQIHSQLPHVKGWSLWQMKEPPGFLVIFSQWDSDVRAKEEARKLRLYTKRPVSIRRTAGKKAAATFSVQIGTFKTRSQARAFGRRIQADVEKKQ